MFNKTKIILPNGMTIEGTPEQVSMALRALGYEKLIPEDYYFSESKQEYLKITEMNTAHLKNAILKYAMKWLEELRDVDNPSTVATSLRAGITNKTIRAMLNEYATREEE
jgi:hypothetical protein